MVYLVRPLAEIRQDLKNGFRSIRRGSKIKHFPFKFWHLKFSFLFSKVIFSKFSKDHVLSRLKMSSVLSIVYNYFLIFDNVIRITLKVPLIRILLSIGS